MNDYHDLRLLPPSHPMRNAPLADISAETMMPPAGWRTITAKWGIARNTFNELGPVLVDNESEWRAPVPSDDPADY